MGLLRHVVLGSVAATAAYVAVRMQTNFGPTDILLPPPVANTSVDQHFTETYYHARALFRKHAKAAGAELHTLPLADYEHLDLTTDIAVFKGASDKVIVHLSGTHGVEGFAGSAIQSGILQDWNKYKQGPTVVFVHAVNPYGFSMLRRFNEHNVDLNRNWLTDAQFKKMRATDPNKSGYMDFFTLLNPGTDSLQWENWFWVRVVFDLVTKGWNAMKRAAVSGNYHMPEAVYYGGSELEPSLVTLRDFLSTHIDLAGLSQFAIVDVHTGLGPSGVDTVILMPGTTAGVAENVFQQEFAAGNAVVVHDPSHTVVKGYEEVGGFVAEGIAAMVPPSTKAEVVTLAQEFGTIPPLLVMKAVIQENSFVHNAPSQRLPYAERLRDVFYTHNSASWRQGVFSRGVTVFEKLHAHLSAELIRSIA